MLWRKPTTNKQRMNKSASTRAFMCSINQPSLPLSSVVSISQRDSWASQTHEDDELCPTWNQYQVPVHLQAYVCECLNLEKHINDKPYHVVEQSLLIIPEVLPFNLYLYISLYLPTAMYISSYQDISLHIDIYISISLHSSMHLHI